MNDQDVPRFIVLEEESPRWFVYDTWLDKCRPGAFRNEDSAIMCQKQLERAAKAKGEAA